MKEKLLTILTFVCSFACCAQVKFSILDYNNNIQHIFSNLEFNGDSAGILFPIYPYHYDQHYLLEDALIWRNNNLIINPTTYHRFEDTPLKDTLDKIKNLLLGDSICQWFFSDASINIPCASPLKYEKHIDYKIGGQPIAFRIGHIDFIRSANITFQNLTIKEVEAFAKYFSYTLRNSQINELRLYEPQNGVILGYDGTSKNFHKYSIDKLLVIADSVGELILNSVYAKNISIYANYVDGSKMQFIYGPISDTIGIYDTRIKDGTILDLTKMRPNGGKKCNIILKNCDVGKIKLNYTYFRLAWDSTFKTIDDKRYVYRQLLDNFKKNTQDEDTKLLDIEYKSFEYTKDSNWLRNKENDLDRWWWNYGYDKIRVVKNSFIIFGWTILFNLIVFPLLFTVYQPENFKNLDNRLRAKYITSSKKILLYKLNKAPMIAAYTAYVFWGIKLELGNTKFEKSWWAFPFLILMMEYLGGIVCLAYIANLIITKP